VCLRLNSTTPTASQTMWSWQNSWNQNVFTPSERRPTSEFQMKNPGGEALALDIGPAGRVDQEHEHVLLPIVEAGAAAAGLPLGDAPALRVPGRRPDAQPARLGIKAVVRP
jgi:hypothetical protein